MAGRSTEGGMGRSTWAKGSGTEDRDMHDGENKLQDGGPGLHKQQGGVGPRLHKQQGGEAELKCGVAKQSFNQQLVNMVLTVERMPSKTDPKPDSFNYFTCTVKNITKCTIYLVTAASLSTPLSVDCFNATYDSTN